MEIRIMNDFTKEELILLTQHLDRLDELNKRHDYFEPKNKYNIRD